MSAGAAEPAGSVAVAISVPAVVAIDSSTAAVPSAAADVADASAAAGIAGQSLGPPPVIGSDPAIAVSIDIVSIDIESAGAAEAAVVSPEGSLGTVEAAAMPPPTSTSAPTPAAAHRARFRALFMGGALLHVVGLCVRAQVPDALPATPTSGRLSGLLMVGEGSALDHHPVVAGEGTARCSPKKAIVFDHAERAAPSSWNIGASSSKAWPAISTLSAR